MSNARKLADVSTALDDYEEGTWTPNISSGGSSFAYAVQQGRYTKIGDLVHVKFYLQLNSGTMTSAQFGVGNFPFASASVHYTIGVGWNNSSSGSVAHPAVLLPPGSTSVLFYTQGGQNLSAVSGTTMGSGTSQLWSFTYYV